jgi:RNA polymerase sigma-B factor
MRSTSRTDAYDCYAPQLAELAELPHDDPRRARLQDELVRAFRPVARNIASRFARRGEPADDLEQVATIGLIHALDRYDPDKCTDFLSYAVPTMMGEVRRHFRDSAWAIRTPRSVKDRYLTVGNATTTLSHRLGRAPTVDELAEHLTMSAEEVREAYALGTSYRPTSLDRTLGDADDSRLVDLLGTVDHDLEQVDTRALVGDLLAQLPERERTMLTLRFVHEKTQREIAAELCISQMHVSRLLTQTLALLRERLERQSREDDDGPTLTAAVA